MTVDCDYQLYAEVECLASGKYAIIDLWTPVKGEAQHYFCIAHLCAEHALGVLKQTNQVEITRQNGV